MVDVEEQDDNIEVRNDNQNDNKIDKDRLFDSSKTKEQIID